MALMPLLPSALVMSTSMSPRLRQFTATQGLDGTKWNLGDSLITVTLSPARASAFISYAMGMPPRPAPRITMCAMSCLQWWFTSHHETHQTRAF